MKLQTQIPLEKQSHQLIDYHSNMLLLGSCFAEYIGEQFDYYKFQHLQNPFGILFHPKAIETLVSNAIHGKAYEDSDAFFHNEQWHCYDAHSKLNTTSKDELLKTLNTQLNVTAKQLHDATHIILTFGTAWVYNHFKSNLPVANCHKVSQREFVKQLLSVDDIVNSITLMVNQIRQVNPKATIIFTVSPVRHIKDGFIENTQSKAHLITAIHQFLTPRAASQCFYFPSYEIMLDELRDYRFYTEDMLHPNPMAIRYIWEKFQHAWIVSEAQKLMNTIDEIQKGLKHKPFHPNSESHQHFLQQLELKKQGVQSQFPYIKF
ncbi:MAG: GSCFA domain-containing protein [Gelidibacter sp.]